MNNYNPVHYPLNKEKKHNCSTIKYSPQRICVYEDLEIQFKQFNRVSTFDNTIMFGNNTFRVSKSNGVESCEQMNMFLFMLSNLLYNIKDIRNINDYLDSIDLQNLLVSSTGYMRDDCFMEEIRSIDVFMAFNKLPITGLKTVEEG